MEFHILLSLYTQEISEKGVAAARMCACISLFCSPEEICMVPTLIHLRVMSKVAQGQCFLLCGYLPFCIKLHDSGWT
jgi:hypothetical protein